MQPWAEMQPQAEMQHTVSACIRIPLPFGSFAFSAFRHVECSQHAYCAAVCSQYAYCAAVCSRHAEQDSVARLDAGTVSMTTMYMACAVRLRFAFVDF